MNDLQKESHIYTNFIRQNALILISIPLAFGIGGYLYKSAQPEVLHREALLQINYSNENIEKQMALTDAAVVKLRSAQLQQTLSLSGKSTPIIHKSGPVAITLVTEGVDRSAIVEDLEILKKYTLYSFPISEVGQATEYPKDNNLWFFVGISALTGIAFGVIIALLTHYLKNF